MVNAAAWTDVDGAESNEAEATRVNGLGRSCWRRPVPRRGPGWCTSDRLRVRRTASTPYAEDAPLAPVSAYGRSKAAGENAVRRLLPDASYVVRTAWLYGEHGGNFVRTMATLEASRETLDVVDDQIGAPTWTREVAEAVIRLVTGDAPAGVYHATAQGQTSWFGLAQAVFAEIGADPERIRSTTTDKFPRPAPRPAYSVLGHDAWDKVGLAPPGDLRVALHEAAPAVTGR